MLPESNLLPASAARCWLLRWCDGGLWPKDNQGKGAKVHISTSCGAHDQAGGDLQLPWETEAVSHFPPQKLQDAPASEYCTQVSHIAPASVLLMISRLAPR